jgi:hypothetical protein
MKGMYDNEIDTNLVDTLNRDVAGDSVVAYCLRSPSLSVSTRLEPEDRPDPEMTESTEAISMALEAPLFGSVQP